MNTASIAARFGVFLLLVNCDEKHSAKDSYSSNQSDSVRPPYVSSKSKSHVTISTRIPQDDLPDDMSITESVRWLRKHIPLSPESRALAISWYRRKSHERGKNIEEVLSGAVQSSNTDKTLYSSLISDLLQGEPGIFIDVVNLQEDADLRSTTISEFIGRAASANNISDIREVRANLDPGYDRQRCGVSLIKLVIKIEGPQSALDEVSLFEYPEERKLAFFQIASHLKKEAPDITNDFAREFRIQCREVGLEAEAIGLNFEEEKQLPVINEE